MTNSKRFKPAVVTLMIEVWQNNVKFLGHSYVSKPFPGAGHVVVPAWPGSIAKRACGEFGPGSGDPQINSKSPRSIWERETGTAKNPRPIEFQCIFRTELFIIHPFHYFYSFGFKLQKPCLYHYLEAILFKTRQSS